MRSLMPGGEARLVSASPFTALGEVEVSDAEVSEGGVGRLPGGDVLIRGGVFNAFSNSDDWAGGGVFSNVSNVLGGCLASTIEVRLARGSGSLTSTAGTTLAKGLSSELDFSGAALP